MNTHYHHITFDVVRRSQIIKFDAMLQSSTKELLGIHIHEKGINNSKLIGSKVGVVSIEIKNRKIHLATLPVFADGLQARKRDFYPCFETIEKDFLINGTYMDQTDETNSFHPYRVTVSLKTSA